MALVHAASTYSANSQDQVETIEPSKASKQTGSISTFSSLTNIKLNTLTNVCGTKRRRSSTDTMEIEHLAKRFMHGSPDHIVDRMSISAYRRPSVEEMDGVEHYGNPGFCNNLTNLDHAALMASHNLPPGAQICTFDNIVHITADVQEMNLYGTRQMLYADVEGTIPRDHLAMDDVDPHNFLMDPIRLNQELHRSYDLSHQQIWNAPSFFEDLPWGEIEEKGISFEEMIIYFPNHVMRWPYLALFFRMKNWDKLFFRATRLINKARGSHYQDDRGRKHVEVLPLMMKVQRAIQEIIPTYTLSDHHLWHDMLSQEKYESHIRNSLKTKPRNFPSNPSTATVATAAGYITGENEFQSRQFSRSVLHLQPHRPAPKPKDPFIQYEIGVPSFAQTTPNVFQSHLPRFDRPSKPQPADRRRTMGSRDDDADMTDGVLGDDESGGTTDCLRGLKCKGIGKWCKKAHSAFTKVGSNCLRDRERGVCNADPFCERRQCKFKHPKLEAQKLVDQKYRDRSDEQTVEGWIPRNCRNDPDCNKLKCQYLHPKRDDGSFLKDNSPSTPWTRLDRNDGDHISRNSQPVPHEPVNCLDDPDCEILHCMYRHPMRDGVRALPLEPLRTQPNKKNKVCKFGATCRDKTNCCFVHPTEPGYDDLGQQPNMTRNQDPGQAGKKSDNDNQQDQQDRRKVLCHFKPCTNAKCPFGHRSPSAPPTSQWNADHWCHFGAECVNNKCMRNHPSPAAKKARRDAQGSGKHNVHFDTPRGGNKNGQNGRGNMIEQEYHNHKDRNANRYHSRSCSRASK